MMAVDAILAYAAGLIDGEGHISINKYDDSKRRCTNMRYWVIVIIGMTDEEPLRQMWRRWGGSLTLRKRKKDCWKDTWIWQINCRKAYKFLRDIRPYLIAKAKQADIALRFYEVMGKADMPSPKSPKGKCLSPEAIKKREECYQQLRALNRRGIIPPAETE